MNVGPLIRESKSKLLVLAAISVVAPLYVHKTRYVVFGISSHDSTVPVKAACGTEGTVKALPSKLNAFVGVGACSRYATKVSALTPAGNVISTFT